MPQIKDLTRLYAFERRAVNGELAKLPSYPRSAEAGLDAVKNVLGVHGLSVWQVVQEPVLGGQTDRYTFSVERLSPSGDPEESLELENTMLVFTAFKMVESFNVEVVSYVS